MSSPLCFFSCDGGGHGHYNNNIGNMCPNYVDNTAAACNPSRLLLCLSYGFFPFPAHSSQQLENCLVCNGYVQTPALNPCTHEMNNEISTLFSSCSYRERSRCSLLLLTSEKCRRKISKVEFFFLAPITRNDVLCG